MNADDFIGFLKWAENKQRPRLHLCEEAYDNGEHVPIFQRMGRQANGTHTYIGEDTSGQTGIREIVDQYNQWFAHDQAMRQRDKRLTGQTDDQSNSRPKIFDGQNSNAS